MADRKWVKSKASLWHIFHSYRAQNSTYEPSYILTACGYDLKIEECTFKNTDDAPVAARYGTTTQYPSDRVCTNCRNLAYAISTTADITDQMVEVSNGT